jgi:hypothetical protein
MMSSTLTAAGEANWYEPVVLQDAYKSAEALPERPGQRMVGNLAKLKLFPNPAGSYFIVEYEFDDIISNAQIKITDVLGRTQKIIVIIKHFDQFVVNTTGLDDGIYFVVLEANGKTIRTEKITFSK